MTEIKRWIGWVEELASVEARLLRGSTATGNAIVGGCLIVATVRLEGRPNAEVERVAGSSVGGDVAADWEGLDDRGELRVRVVDERPVDGGRLEAQAGGRVVGEEAASRVARPSLSLMVRPN